MRVLFVVGALLLTGCAAPPPVVTPPVTQDLAFVLTSNAFEDGAPIPQVHTCDGANTSPQLSARGAPAGTVAFALTVVDPDVPTPQAPVRDFVHWLAWNMPAANGTLDLAEDAAPPMEGAHDGGGSGYTGPCPPVVSPAHRYVFTLHALDALLDLPAGASRADVEAAVERHTLGEAVLVGTYARLLRDQAQ